MASRRTLSVSTPESRNGFRRKGLSSTPYSLNRLALERRAHIAPKPARCLHQLYKPILHAREVLRRIRSGDARFLICTWFLAGAVVANGGEGGRRGRWLYRLCLWRLLVEQRLGLFYQPVERVNEIVQLIGDLFYFGFNA